MPARRGRPRKGDRRIDAAIDHFTVMGYAARDVKAVVTDLLKVIFRLGLFFLIPPCKQRRDYGGTVGFGFSVCPRID
jgi:hypothetical protein